MNYYSICYVSTSRQELSPFEIENIFATASVKNEENKVTGILLHNIGHFFQVLEGEEKHVKSLFQDIISNDSRHTEITTIFDKQVIEPLFSGYNSKFNIVKNSEDLENIKKYLIKKTGKASDKVLRILKPFILYQV